MTSLWEHLDRALMADEGSESVKAHLVDEVFDWLGDRVVMDDMLGALREILSEASEEALLAAIAAVGRVVRQP